MATDIVSGTIRVRIAGTKTFRTLKDGEAIPSGTVIDATKGRVRLTSVDANGKQQSADFYDGIFTVIQPKSGKGRVDLILKRPTCDPKPRGAARAAKNGKPTRLWGKGKGKFRTRGRYGAATVTGTWWLTEDR